MRRWLNGWVLMTAAGIGVYLTITIIDFVTLNRMYRECLPCVDSYVPRHAGTIWAISVIAGVALFASGLTWVIVAWWQRRSGREKRP